MNKKICVNLLIAANADETASLAKLTRISEFIQENRLKNCQEALNLEAEAIACENSNITSALTLWLKSIELKVSYYKSNISKVSDNQLQKYLLQFLNLLYSQIIYYLGRNKASKSMEILGILASYSNKSYRLPENERQRCKIRYYIFYAIIYFIKGKFQECIGQINIVIDKAGDTFDKVCCTNIIALCLCKMESHNDSLKYHLEALVTWNSKTNIAITEAILLYNITIEYLHLEDRDNAAQTVQRAYILAESNRSNHNLIFSKIFLLYQDVCGKEFKPSAKAQTTKNNLKKKTLNFILKTLTDQQVIESRTLKPGITRGRAENSPENLKIISLGSKISKKRSKTEHAGSRKKKLPEKNAIVQRFNQIEAAKKLQRAWKIYRRAKIQRKRRLEEKSAMKIQSVFKMSTQKKRFLIIKAKINKIQANWRRWLCLKAFKDRKRAVYKIQANFLGRKEHKKYMLLKVNVTRIQSLIRGWLKRSLLKRQQLAARLLQKQARILLLSLYIKKNESFRQLIRRNIISLIRELATQLSKVKNLSVIKEEEVQSRTNASSIAFDLLPILKIQSFIRMIPQHQYFQFCRKSAVQIQRIIRGFLARKSILRQDNAVKTIQRLLCPKLKL